MAAVRYALKVETNATIGLTVLERTGVVAQRGERMQPPETTAPETGFQRQCWLIASVMLEAHEELGVDLPEDASAALAKDAQELQKAKQSGSA